VEAALRIVYLPQAVFRVRPVARCTASMPGHSEAVLCVAFSPDGRRLASGSGDTTARSQRPRSPPQPPPPSRLTSPAAAFAVRVALAPPPAHPCSLFPLTAPPKHLGRQVRFWDLDTQTPHRECRGHKNWVLCLAWSPDGAHLVSGDMDGDLWLWDPATGESRGRCQGHRKWITSLARAPGRRDARGAAEAPPPPPPPCG